MPSPSAAATVDAGALSTRLAGPGFAFVPGAAMRELLAQCGDLSAWDAFADSWNRLAPDDHMADHGRYRRRRHAAFACEPDGLLHRLPPRPHFQALDYNPLNGGVERWFAQVEERFAEGPSVAAVLAACRGVFEAVAGACGWFVELHQFRIEAGPGMQGKPTPEGMHRDGVDYVLVLLVNRRNIARGTTVIGAPDGAFTDRFTLAESFDAALLDDRRVYHGVTPVRARDAALPAHRDMLVATFRRA